MKFIIVGLVCVVLFVSHSYSQVAVIANKNMSMQISSTQQVSDIYTLDIKTAGSSKLVVFDVKNEELKGKLLAAIGKTSADLKKIWMKAQLSGDGNAPEALSSEAEVVTKVASTTGGIGYVSSSNVTPDVKVLYTLK
jgi:hypothetical protein